MMWSLLAQQQTWFGNEPYKSYGIQVLPLTAVGELRDTPEWIAEMLPLFLDSCDKDDNSTNMGDYSCTKMGWRILVLACQATIGDWETAWAGVNAQNNTVYASAGGNGHSKSNTLWYIATRPPVKPTVYAKYQKMKRKLLDRNEL